VASGPAATPDQQELGSGQQALMLVTARFGLADLPEGGQWRL